MSDVTADPSNLALFKFIMYGSSPTSTNGVIINVHLRFYVRFYDKKF